ncbi:MAG: ATP-binding protein [Myxococcota bacterium]
MVLAALTLISSQWLAWAGVSRAAEVAERGEAEVLGEALASYLRGLGAPIDTQDLEDFVEAHRELGLRYVAVAHPRGRVEGGEGQLADPRPPERFVQGGDRLRATIHAPPPRPMGHGPRHRRDGPVDMGPDRRLDAPRPGPEGPPRRAHDRGRPPPPAMLTLEIEPRLGKQLREDALRALIAASVIAVLFLLAGLALMRAIEQREAMARRAERDRHLAALGEMSAVLSHEIRNPLASLKGHAQLLMETLGNDERAHAKAERIVGEALRLEELTSNLLEFVRSGELRLAPTDVADLVREAIDGVGPDRFELVVGQGRTDAVVDRARLHQTLTNLLVNATQASNRRSEVAVEPKRRHVTVRVSDHGEGIEDGQEEAIFEPFHTTRVRGTGLGLAIARRIVEAHQGTLRAENRQEGGATFTIVLPRSMQGGH